MTHEASTYRLALVGFGSVGRGLAEILSLHRRRLQERYGADVCIVAACTRRWCVYDPGGIDAATLLQSAASGAVDRWDCARAWNADEMIASVDADVLGGSVADRYDHRRTGDGVYLRGDGARHARDHDK
jgi:homoserine dehydrogenase